MFPPDVGFPLHVLWFHIPHVQRDCGSGSGAGHAEGQLNVLSNSQFAYIPLSVKPHNVFVFFWCRALICWTISSTYTNISKLESLFIS